MLKKGLALSVALLVSASVQARPFSEETMETYLEPVAKEHVSEDEKKGLEIYTKQFLLDEGWKDMETDMDMRLYDARGQESRRKVHKAILEDSEAPDKTVGIFLEPADIRGTVMLTWEQSYGADEQWLYLPALKRTKKINAENKSGSFLGTEFAWEDISTTELSKYHYKFLRDEGDTWVVERVPVYSFSGYSRQVTWVDKNNYQTVKIEFYDKKGDLLKTLELSDFQHIEDKYWRPLHFEMMNHQNKKRTVLQLTPYKADTGIDPKMFTSFGLQRLVKR